MARIRTMKPEFWSSPSTAACEDPWARLLFVAMWNWADDAGRGTANPKELAGFAFPNDEKIDSADIRRMLGEIRRAFDVILYMVDGRPYYAIPSWDEHQKIDRRSSGKHPGPEEGTDWDPDPQGPPDQREQRNSTIPAEPSTEPAESSPSPRRTLGAGTGEQGNRGTGEEGGRLGNSGSTRARERVGAAHSARAHRLAQDYANSCHRLPPAKVRAILAVEIDDLIEVGWTDDEIRAAIDLWASKGLGPGALTSVAHELLNQRPARSRTDTDIERLLTGPDPAAPAAGFTTAAPLRAIPGGAAC